MAINDILAYFDSRNFFPHGHCFLWQPNVLWLHVISDMGIAIAYYSIPLGLLYFVRKREDLPFKNIFFLFSTFICLCGTTHIMSVWVIWNPDYTLEGVIKALTAAVSIATFFIMLKLMPHALQLKSPAQLARLNEELERNITERDLAQKALNEAYQKIEKEVEKRTAELRENNHLLQQEINDRLETEKELHDTMDKLTKSNIDLEHFAYICSHDLQEPIRMISNFSQRLQHHLESSLDEKTSHYIEYITTGAANARTLISDVLTLARTGNEIRKYEVVNCNDVMDTVLFTLKERITESNTHVTFDKLPEVMAHRVYIIQIFQNLINNAMKFCVKETAPRIHVSAEKDGGHWLFSLSDNGIGIESQYQEKIFHIFQRLHSRDNYPGTGIGLTIVKKIIEQYGGRIWLASEPGKGTTFFFTLPSIKEL